MLFPVITLNEPGGTKVAKSETGRFHRKFVRHRFLPTVVDVIASLPLGFYTRVVSFNRPSRWVGGHTLP